MMTTTTAATNYNSCAHDCGWSCCCSHRDDHLDLYYAHRIVDQHRVTLAEPFQTEGAGAHCRSASEGVFAVSERLHPLQYLKLLTSAVIICWFGGADQ